MFVELVQVLRCPKDGSELVARVDTAQERQIVAGELGCPRCQSRYPIRDGAVWFDEAPPHGRPCDEPSEESAIRIAALLDLVDERGFAVLCGDWAVHAPLLMGVSPTPLVLLNPTAPVDWRFGHSVVYCGDGVPFATGSVRGLALSGDEAPGILDCLAAGGRVLGPAGVAIPASVSLLARDDASWVGERAGSSTLVSLGRAHTAPGQRG